MNGAGIFASWWKSHFGLLRGYHKAITTTATTFTTCDLKEKKMWTTAALWPLFILLLRSLPLILEKKIFWFSTTFTKAWSCQKKIISALRSRQHEHIIAWISMERVAMRMMSFLRKLLLMINIVLLCWRSGCWTFMMRQGVLTKRALPILTGTHQTNDSATLRTAQVAGQVRAKMVLLLKKYPNK